MSTYFTCSGSSDVEFLNVHPGLTVSGGGITFILRSVVYQTLVLLSQSEIMKRSIIAVTVIMRMIVSDSLANGSLCLDLDPRGESVPLQGSL